ncbi:MAG: hypothetical protein AB7V43_17400 [Acidimicrobiia bacterium]
MTRLPVALVPVHPDGAQSSFKEVRVFIVGVDATRHGACGVLLPKVDQVLLGSVGHSCAGGLEPVPVDLRHGQLEHLDGQTLVHGHDAVEVHIGVVGISA